MSAPTAKSLDQCSGADMDVVELLDGTEAVVRSPALRRLMGLLRRVAGHHAAVLIMGETGTGKELVARAIHYYSCRRERPFVDVNCAALPEHLAESELFGYEKGAFSGADTTKPGLFELAGGGTLFLDEIGDLDPKMQVKLLRVLDGVPYYRLGGKSKVSVDVRILAATNRDMEAAVRSGKFRRDLFYRLSQFQILVPPLRERPEDIVGIADYFLRQYQPNSQFSKDAVQALQEYSWPGNVRELKNLIFKTVMYAESAAIEVQARDLSFENPIAPAKSATTAISHGDGLNSIEKHVILDTLARTGGHRGRTAEQLGISRRTLSRKLKEYREEAQSQHNCPGKLSHQQQRYFRVMTEFPVVISCADKQFHANCTNLSSSGIGVHLSQTGDFRSAVTLTFTLPGSSYVINAKAQLAWMDADGRAGFRFTEMLTDSRHELESWLQKQIVAEGWLVESGPSQHL
jgi:two-component system, NtrC family, response regulator AtoC